MRLRMPSRRVGMFALALLVLTGPNNVFAQKRKQGGPSLPHPILLNVFPGGLKAGNSVEITLKGTDLEGVTSLWFDHPGLKATHVKGLTFKVSADPGTPIGHHDLRASGTYGISNPRAFGVGDRSEANEVEPNNSVEKATPISINSVVNGVVGPTDVDWFAFDGKKGQRLFCDVEAERIDSRLDATIRLYDAAGRELDESRDVFGADPFLDTTLPADGRYLLKLHDVIYKGSDDFTYRLTLTDGPRIDAILPGLIRAGETSTHTLIGRNLGGEVAADLSVDGLPVERKSITVTALTSEDLDPAYPTRGFVPSASAPRRGLDYVLTLPSGTSNPFFLAEAVDPIVVEHEPNNEPMQAQTIEPPCDISGTFGAPGDMDYYRIRLKKGSALSIEASSERIGSAAVPIFVVQKVNEKESEQTPAQDLATSAENPDRGDPSRFGTKSVDAFLKWTAPDDGLYQIAMNDLYGTQRGDVRLSYRLSIRPERPDFHLFLLPDAADMPDALALPVGGRELASVLAVRSDGFNGPIKVEAFDLPPGVRCDPVVIAAGQTSAPLVFEAAENAVSGVVGTVRLIGRARFGDRKDDLNYVPGVETLGPDVAHAAVGGVVVWPLAANPQQVGANKPPPVSRLTRGSVLKIVDPAPLSLSARASSGTITTPGSVVLLDLTVNRRSGFDEAVAVNLIGPLTLPPNAAVAPAVTIAKNQGGGTFALTLAKALPPGLYTLVLQGAGPYPFSKDPKAKTKPNVNLSEPSNSVLLTVRPAPATLAVHAKGGALKAGGSLEIEVTVTSKEATATGPFVVSLQAPSGLKLAADRVEAVSGKPVKIVVKAAGDSPIGVAAGLAVRVAVPVRGVPVEMNEPVAINIVK